ncbi:MAG: hypothetical protein KGI63_13500, partial [Xanthomonadaceae bacterium]|nr:hypothetical protein [Xanthomonadaceae bacterium]
KGNCEMLSMYPGAGMGAAGTGMGAPVMAPGGTLNPQLMAMLSALRGAQASQQQPGAVPTPPMPGIPAPTAPGMGAAGPMASFIGAPQGPNPGMQTPTPQLPQVPQPQQPQSIGAAMQPGINSIQNILQAHLQQAAPPGAQAGVPPNAQGTGAATAQMGAGGAAGNQQALQALQLLRAANLGGLFGGAG